VSQMSRFFRKSVALWLVVAVVGLVSPAFAKGDKSGSNKGSTSYDKSPGNSSGNKGVAPAKGIDKEKPKGGKGSDNGQGNSTGKRNDGKGLAPDKQAGKDKSFKLGKPSDNQVVVLYGQPVSVERQWFAQAEPSGVRYSFAPVNIYWFGAPHSVVNARGNWRPWNQGRGPR
jgi:hypothetical protein